jgi:hypothetical protein
MERKEGDPMRIILKPLGAALLIAVILLCVVTTVLATRRASVAAQMAPATASTPGSILPIGILNTPASTGDSGSVAGSGKLALDNGSFDRGGDLPDGWTAPPWVGQGTAHLSRDTTIYHSAPASLRLDAATDDTYTAVDHHIAGYTSGTSFVVRGWVRVQGSPQEATIGVRGRDTLGETAPTHEWAHVFDARNAADWTPFQTRVHLTPGSKYAYFVVVLRGKGVIWTDDVTVTR